MVIFDLKNYNQQCLRIVLAHLRHFDDLVISREFVQKSFLHHVSRITVETMYVGTEEDEIAQQALKLLTLANNEEDRLRGNETYITAISKSLMRAQA